MSLLALIWLVAEVLIASFVFELDYDEGVYLQTAFQFAQGQTLYGQLFVSQPPILIVVLSAVIRIFGRSVLAARFVTVLATGAVLLFVHLLARELLNRTAAYVSVCIGLVLSPLFQLANIVQSDIPSVAFGVSSVYLMVLYNRRERLGWLVGSAVAFAVAAGFKILVPFYFFPLSLLMIIRLNPQASGQSWFSLSRVVLAHLLFGAVVAACLIVEIAPFPLRPFFEQVWGLGASGVFGGSSSTSGAGHLRDIFYQWFMLNPIVLALSVYALVRTFKTNRSVFILLVVWGGFQGLYFGLMRRWLWPHHIVSMMPIVLICAAEGARLVFRGILSNRSVLSSWRRHGAAALAVLVVLVLGMAVPNIIADIQVTNESLRAAESSQSWKLVRFVRDMTAPADLCLTDDQMITFRAGRATFPNLVDTSWKRVLTGSINADTFNQLPARPRLVLFSSGRLGRFKSWRNRLSAESYKMYRIDQNTIYVRSAS